MTDLYVDYTMAGTGGTGTENDPFHRDQYAIERQKYQPSVTWHIKVMISRGFDVILVVSENAINPTNLK